MAKNINISIDNRPTSWNPYYSAPTPAPTPSGGSGGGSGSSGGGRTVKFILFLTAVVSLATAVDKFMLQADTPDDTAVEQPVTTPSATPTVTWSPVFLTPADEAEDAVTDYFNAGVGEMSAYEMWTTLTTTNWQGGQVWTDFESFWDKELVAVDLQVSPGVAPIVESDGSVWVQWTAWFKYDPAVVAWAPADGWSETFSMASFKMVLQDGAYRIDDSESYSCGNMSQDECAQMQFHGADI